VLFGARIVANVNDIPFKKKILEVSPNADPKVLEFFFRDMQRRALALDVKEERRDVTVKEISAVLQGGDVLIVLIKCKDSAWRRYSSLDSLKRVQSKRDFHSRSALEGISKRRNICPEIQGNDWIRRRPSYDNRVG
jgi:predicted DNA binding protein